MNAEDSIRNQYEACGAVLDALLADSNTKSAYNENLQILSDLDASFNVVSHRPEAELFRLGLKEYQFASLAAGMGFYRQAFASLRLSIELCLAAIEFSANELRLRNWLRGDADIVWSSLMDDSKGVYAKNVVKVFFEDLQEYAPQYRTMCEKLYRECSEYVHGNLSTHTALPDKIEFSKPVYLVWNQKARTARLAILFAFVSRYFCDLEPAVQEALSPVLIDTLGHLEPIRVRLGGTGGD